MKLYNSVTLKKKITKKKYLDKPKIKQNIVKEYFKHGDRNIFFQKEQHYFLHKTK